jgi:hypothetical protein
MSSRSKPAPRRLATSPFNAARDAVAPVQAIAVGDRVTHEVHGMGRAIALEGDRSVIVDFRGDVRRVALDSSRLELLRRA